MEELRNSPRYIKTFAEYIKSGDDEEIRALLTENVSGTIPVPELVYDAVRTAWTKDGIMNLVRKSYLKGNLKVGFEISSDGAQIHSEGADRIDEEQLVLGVVNLIPSNIKKYIAISDEVYDLAPEEFLTYVYSELTYQIAKKCGEELVTRIVSLSTQSNVPVVDNIESSITASTVAMALSKLCSEAQNPVIVMNKASWGEFKKAQYENKFRVDPFEGLPVVFNNALKPFNSATTGETFAIVGDFGNGALANYPNGEDILVKTDDITLAQSDLIKIIGRQYVAVDVVAPNHFTVINKGEGATLSITENGDYDVTDYDAVNVNVSGGGGGGLELLKTVLTLINEKDTDVSIPAGSFLYDYAIILGDFIDNAPNRLTSHIDIDNELHVLDLSDLIPTLPANTTATYNLYYLSNDTACNPAIEFSENYGSQLSNMTFDTDAFLVDDATADSAITLTWDK